MLNKWPLAIGLVLFGAATTAHAGPPLICHPLDIGSAKSLPWGAGTDNWDNPDHSYDVKRVSADTLAFLNRQTPVVVRMETMRRAAIYGVQDHKQASTLAAALKQRLKDAEAAGKPDELALFDYGYFLSTLKQIEWRYKEDMTGGVDGYTFVQKALAIRDNPAMHFAAAQMLPGPEQAAAREEHLRKAQGAVSYAKR